MRRRAPLFARGMLYAGAGSGETRPQDIAMRSFCSKNNSGLEIRIPKPLPVICWGIERRALFDST